MQSASTSSGVSMSATIFDQTWKPKDERSQSNVYLIPLKSGALLLGVSDRVEYIHGRQAVGLSKTRALALAKAIMVHYGKA